MTDFSKKEAIRTLEQHGYTYLGFQDAGWGEKFYTFNAPYDPMTGGNSVVTYKLGEMRRRAYLLDMQEWLGLGPDHWQRRTQTKEAE